MIKDPLQFYQWSLKRKRNPWISTIKTYPIIQVVVSTKKIMKIQKSLILKVLNQDKNMIIKFQSKLLKWSVIYSPATFISYQDGKKAKKLL